MSLKRMLFRPVLMITCKHCGSFIIEGRGSLHCQKSDCISEEYEIKKYSPFSSIMWILGTGGIIAWVLSTQEMNRSTLAAVGCVALVVLYAVVASHFPVLRKAYQLRNLD
jgi:hypothetical protein